MITQLYEIQFEKRFPLGFEFFPAVPTKSSIHKEFRV